MMKATIPSIEAHGVKGMKSNPWRKTFKSIEALNAWVEKHGAEVHAIREITADENTFR
jgi:type II secretory pathway component PulM